MLFPSLLRSPPVPYPSRCWSLRGNVGLSAVCAYSITAVEEVFSKGKYMQKATVEQSHTKWIRHNGITPSPRPGAVSNIHTCLGGEGAEPENPPDGGRFDLGTHVYRYLFFVLVTSVSTTGCDSRTSAALCTCRTRRCSL